MKTYILDTLEKYKRLSRKLDARTVICNRSWVVFNDCGEREVYKFKEDGTMQIILSGRITVGKWEFDPNDNSISIFASDQALMVHPGMYDDVVMALKVDGTDEISFLIDSNNKDNFAPQSLTELLDYFETKNILFLKAEEDERKRLEQLAIQEAERLEQERKKKELAELNDKIDKEFTEFLRERKYKPIIKLDCKRPWCDVCSSSGCLSLLVFVLFIVSLVRMPKYSMFIFVVFAVMAALYWIIVFPYIKFINTQEFDELLDNFISKQENKEFFTNEVTERLSHMAKNSASDAAVIKYLIKILFFSY